MSRARSIGILLFQTDGAAHFFQTDGIVFTDCDIHDVPSPMLVFNECGDKIWNETPVSGLSGEYDVDESGALTGSSRGYLPYETVFAEEERPTGAGSLQPFGIQLSFFDVVLTGDFTMRMKADSDIMLHATASDGSTSGFIWSVDREGVLELTPSEDGSECRIHQIGEYPEGVWITVEKDGMVQSIEQNGEQNVFLNNYAKYQDTLQNTKQNTEQSTEQNSRG